jgi:hypothetical protein
MADAALCCGDLLAARRWADDTVAVAPGWHQAVALTARARVAIAQGEPDQAERDAHAAVEIADRTGGYLRLPDALECLAALAADANHQHAARLLGAAESMRQRHGEVRFKVFQATYDSSAAAVREASKRWSGLGRLLTQLLLVRVVDSSIVATVRRLPLRVEPLPGEAIDSWLEVTAAQINITLSALARAVDLPIATRPSWIRWLSLDQLETIQAATGVSPNVIEPMTLSVYDGAALRLDPYSHRLDATFPFGALSWSRFCPECIRGSDGRWRLEWRLGRSFACLLHNCLLADRC